MSDSDKQKDNAHKILDILAKSTKEEKMDFANGLINFVDDKLEKKNLEALLPAL
jgi:hypothetical protein